MSRPKHSLGPWTGGREAVNDKDGRLIATIHYKGVSRSDNPVPIDEGHANSTLLACAPAMLDALKRLVEGDKDTGTFWHCAGFKRNSPFPACGKCSACNAVAVIAQAEGQE